MAEYQLMLQPTRYDTFDVQLEWLCEAYRRALEEIGLDMERARLRRFFCSDLSNQAAALSSRPFADPLRADCAVSHICQPPAPPARVALWAWHDDAAAGSSQQERPLHFLKAGITCPEADNSYDQTRGILRKYNIFLEENGMSLADNLLRTWFFVRDIDSNYSGLVAARREFFAEYGLTADTHFIASTGIEGAHADKSVKVVMDAWAVSGIKAEQIAFLAAPDHLSPTHIYGVTFERGTAVTYADCRHVIVSGTASIDGRGEILHRGNVLRQLDRALENVQALLSNAGATLDDMGAFIIYIRDIADYASVREAMQRRFGNLPMVVLHAPVCRPGWLVEVEGIAAVRL